jgi:CubicO group peptidase (beta-lactamase class C family)
MDRIAALVDGALASELGSAAAVSVGDAGVEVFRYVRGHAQRVPTLGEPIDERAMWDLASLTKPMATAVIAMVLVADRKLDLDAPVRRWLPDASTTGTVRQLLAHAAGCTAHVEFFRELHAHPPSDPRAALVAMAAREPAKPPGVEEVYSDLGYILLGAILEQLAEQPLAYAFWKYVAQPLDLRARYSGGNVAIVSPVATELDYRGLVRGRVHDDNAYFGGESCGHAGLFATIGDVAKFAAAIVAAANSITVGNLRPEVVARFVTEGAIANATRRLGWDTPSREPGVSHAGDRWPREHAIGHLGFTGTSLWLDLANRRWVALLTNRVHPTRGGDTADRIKVLRRAVADAAIEALDR